jgi:hypothetical protein
MIAPCGERRHRGVLVVPQLLQTVRKHYHLDDSQLTCILGHLGLNRDEGIPVRMTLSPLAVRGLRSLTSVCRAAPAQRMETSSVLGSGVPGSGIRCPVIFELASGYNSLLLANVPRVAGLTQDLPLKVLEDGRLFSQEMIPNAAEELRVSYHSYFCTEIQHTASDREISTRKAHRKTGWSRCLVADLPG